MGGRRLERRALTMHWDSGSKRSQRWVRAAASVGTLLLVSGVVFGQEEPRVNEKNGDGMDTHLFRPAVDSKGFMYVNGSDILGSNDISFGLVLDYGRNLMRTNNHKDGCGDAGQPDCRGVDALVANSFQGTFGFNYGIANIGSIGITVPVILMAGNEANDIGATGDTYNSGKLDAQKISTVALQGKLRLTRVDKGPGLGIVVQGGVPVGDAPRDLGADPGAWYWPHVVFENRFGSTGRLKLGLDAGYRGHTGKNPKFGLDSTGKPQLKEGEFENGNLATFGAGIAFRVLDPLDLVAETYGSYLVGGKSDSKQKLSQEFLGGIKLFVERNSYLMMGGGSRIFSTGFEAADVRMVLGFVFEPSIGDRDGDGYKDDQDQCPDDPEDFDGFRDEDGCPEPDNDNDGILDVDDRCPNTPEDRDGDEDEDGCPEGQDGDRDGDGILDSRDKCPDDPEDRDGFEDKDGCPEPDNDKDGILDKEDSCPLDPEDKDGFEDTDGCPDPDNDKDQIPDVKDKCPNDPETYNGFEDEDGCPDKGKVVIEGSDIIILEKVMFETNSAKILPESDGILDAVAATLKGHPEFQVVEIAGHADERSSDEYNLKLTRDRAASVVDALVSRGVAKSRLVSQGYGEYCPLDDAHNAAAWEKNRRVEFKVVKTDDGSTGAERGCERAKAKGVLPPPVD
ncbi:MAG: OmpA family protein [Polyangiaceae bacterium]|nr:OmpA family protein [Polyangiaceae bacterium]MCE7892627.1 OmpA family protein [Sorangiineae bacterium PRO1]MCL4753109.1 OmpA family protein [Myxococcales bacterium]